MNMDFGTNKRPIEVIKEEQLEELILEVFILVLTFWVIAQIFMMLMLRNIKLNVEHH